MPAASELIAKQCDVKENVAIQLNGKTIFIQKATRDAAHPELKQKYEQAKNVFEMVTSDFKKYPPLNVPKINEKIEKEFCEELKKGPNFYGASRVKFFIHAIEFFEEKNEFDWKEAKFLIEKHFSYEWSERGLVSRMFSPDFFIKSKDDKWVFYYYQNKKTAELHLNFFKLLLTNRCPNMIAYARVVKDTSYSDTPFRFRLSKYQFVALKKLREIDSLIKSIRWDENCFIHDFILTVTKTEKNQTHFPLRRGLHKAFTVFASGVYPYDKRPSPYPEINPQQKSKLSQAQSVSMVFKDVQAPVFGHGKTRSDKLAGFVFLPHPDTLFNRFFLHDGGTVDRPFEADTEKKANEYYQSKVKGEHPILFGNEYDFKRAAAQNKTKYNEVLARIKWNIRTSGAAIFSDTFAARCIAQTYAKLMYERVVTQYQEMNSFLDSDYQVPIYYYFPEKDNHWMRYTDFQQQQDIKLADDIMTDPNKIKDLFSRKEYEFLLIQSDPDRALSLTCNDLPIILHLMTEGLFVFEEILFNRTSLKQKQSFDQYLLEQAGQYEKFSSCILPQLNTEGDTVMHIIAMRQKKYLFLLPFWENKINTKNSNAWTALHYAARYGHLETAKLLLDHGAKIDEKRR